MRFGRAARLIVLMALLLLVSGLWVQLRAAPVRPLPRPVRPLPPREVPATGKAPITIKFLQDLREAVIQKRVKPGSVVQFLPGEYRGRLDLVDLVGTPEAPIIIESADPMRPIVWYGSSECLHLTSPAYVEIRNIIFVMAQDNLLNIDDNQRPEAPARNIVIKDCVFKDASPVENADALKLSGVRHFRIENCRFENWAEHGSGIDLHGCHGGLIVGCEFRIQPGAGPGKSPDAAEGILAKAGCENITIRNCRFENCGERGVRLGGRTARSFFRPRDATAEARNVIVEGCTFVGGKAAVTFSSSDACIVRHNTIYQPSQWVFRIHQDNVDPKVVACRNGLVADNLIVYRAGQLKGAVDVGPNTAADTFQFDRNFWFAADDPAKSRPKLPAPERDGVYGQDPGLRAPDKGDFSPLPDSPARSIGAHSLPPAATRPR